MAIPRMSPAELKTRVDAGDSITFVDARLKYPFEHSALIVPQALRVAPPAYDVSAIPTTHDLVVYDSDPNEVVAEDVAERLVARGGRVSIMAGGFNGWMAAGGPTTAKPAVGQPPPGADAAKG